MQPAEGHTMKTQSIQLDGRFIMGGVGGGALH
jgi:hypothetical protein